MNLEVTGSLREPPADWVRETRFGQWFLSTDVWRTYVLGPAVEDLARLAGNDAHRPGLLVELGCGNGASLPLLEAHLRPARVLAIDIDRDQLSLAQQRANELETPVEFLCTDARSTGLPTDSVDTIFCHQLVHHVSDQVQLVQEMFRILRPGGVLLLSESCRAFLARWWVRWFFRHPDVVQKGPQEYARLLRDAGFDLSDAAVEASSPWWSLVDFGVLRRYLGAHFQDEESEVLLVGRKPYGMREEGSQSDSECSQAGGISNTPR